MAPDVCLRHRLVAEIDRLVLPSCSPNIDNNDRFIIKIYCLNSSTHSGRVRRDEGGGLRFLGALLLAISMSSCKN